MNIVEGQVVIKQDHGILTVLAITNSLHVVDKLISKKICWS